MDYATTEVPGGAEKFLFKVDLNREKVHPGSIQAPIVVKTSDP